MYISNYHWYAPSVKEIEEIMLTAYNGGTWLHENFSAFEEKMYWSCQPAYTLNDISLNYRAESSWTVKGRQSPISLKTKTETYTNILVATSSGYYLKDDKGRARATRLSSGTLIGSQSAHISNTLALTGTVPNHSRTDDSKGVLTFESTYNAAYLPYLYEFYDHLDNASWSEVESPTNNTANRGDGNLERTEQKGVRCVYYPHNYKTATRAKVDGLSSLYKDGYETTLSTR
jgi:hypothetical protein